MRKLAALIASIAALSATQLAEAATIDFFLTQTAPESTSWDLTANVNDSVILAAVSVEILSAEQGSFTIAQPATIINPFVQDDGFSFYRAGPPVRLGLAPGFSLQDYMVAGPTTGFLIGTWTGPGVPVLNPGNVLDGGTAQDENYEELSFSLTTGNGPTVEYAVTPPAPIPPIPDPKPHVPPTLPIPIPGPISYDPPTNPSNPIPEPSSVLLMLVGAALVARQIHARS